MMQLYTTSLRLSILKFYAVVVKCLFRNIIETLHSRRLLHLDRHGPDFKPGSFVLLRPGHLKDPAVRLTLPGTFQGPKQVRSAALHNDFPDNGLLCPDGNPIVDEALYFAEGDIIRHHRRVVTIGPNRDRAL